MKKMVFLLLMVLGTVAVFAQNGIRFENDSTSFQELLQKAKDENKILFIDCYTSWCGPCKWMVKNVFPNDTVGEFYNQHFICASMDMEKGEGPKIGKLYEVRCYPTYIFLDAQGNVIHRLGNRMSVSSFVNLGKDAISPEKQFVSFKQKYDAGIISKEELMTYMKLRERSCLGIKEEKDKFFSLPSEDSDSLDWVVLRDFGVEYNSFLFKIIVSGRDTLYALHGEEEVNRIIFNSYLEAMMKYIYDKIDTARYTVLKSELLDLGLPSTQNFISDCDLSLYSANEEWDKFASTAVRYVESLPKNEEEYLGLNNIAYVFYQNIEDSVYLNLALGWAKRSVELRKEYFNLDTYASVLFKTGHKEEALKVAEEAIDLGKNQGVGTSETEVLLEKIKAMK